MHALRLQELVSRCATERDSLLWEQFLGRFEAGLRASIRRASRRYGTRYQLADTDDLTQDVYCRLLERGGQNLQRLRADSPAAVRSYLGRIAESVVIDHLRSTGAAKRGHHLMVSPIKNGVFDLAQWAIDGALSPEEKFLLEEQRLGVLSRCQQVLGRRAKDRDLKIFYLAFFEGRTSREICQLLGEGLNPSTVDSLIYRLKKRLGKVGVSLPRRGREVSAKLRT